MFRSAERLLRGQGATYGDVARTWIYIEDILAWYGDFNRARNRCFTDFGLLGNGAERREAERIFLPASTGIEGRNPAGAAAVMDVFAVHSGKSGTVSSRSVSGVRQRSPFRYGSAFSRAMVVDEPECRLVLVSGTASIDEAGASVHLGDTAAQIEQTLKVIQALVREEGAEWENLCEGTVFLKRPEDLPVFLETAKRMGLSDLPTVNVVADVCRDELLFELDAAFAVERRA
jgi:enamine deaminase RidA (YjgF/YER057c/UK114 family)